jgi:hypothetical protein
VHLRYEYGASKGEGNQMYVALKANLASTWVGGEKRKHGTCVRGLIAGAIAQPSTVLRKMLPIRIHFSTSM